MTTPLRVSQVFIPGGIPTFTYNPRTHLKLEQQVEDYLDEGHSILSVSGPTKTGKTVLIKRLVPTSIRLTGGEVQNLEDFLQIVASELGVEEVIEDLRSDESSTGHSTAGKLGISGIGDAQRQRVGGEKVTSSTRKSYSVSLRATVKRELLAKDVTLVIDDFHYIPQQSQAEIVRYLKDPVFDGLRVIVLAVPHRAYDAVRVEREMTGRVKKLEVGFWSDAELAQIAKDGFAALNISDPTDLTSRLVRECFSSPHLMQDFCLKLCKSNEVRLKADTDVPLAPPPTGWDQFFGDIADDASKSSFELLARGPRQRSDRMSRTLKNGQEVDIYGLILHAIAATGPLVELTYEQLRNAVREISADTPPPSHEITRVLDKMTEIAKTKIDGEPVVEYDQEFSKLHIADPFFAFYLRWGAGSIGASLRPPEIAG